MLEPKVLTMPSQFCCRHCGMVTDNPEIVPHPEADKQFREFLEEHKGDWQSSDGATRYAYGNVIKEKYNHSITCPVCENATRFWRDKPFPTDTMTNKEKLDYYLETIPRRVKL